MVQFHNGPLTRQLETPGIDRTHTPVFKITYDFAIWTYCLLHCLYSLSTVLILFFKINIFQIFNMKSGGEDGVKVTPASAACFRGYSGRAPGARYGALRDLTSDAWGRAGNVHGHLQQKGGTDV